MSQIAYTGLAPPLPSSIRDEVQKDGQVDTTLDKEQTSSSGASKESRAPPQRPRPPAPLVIRPRPRPAPATPRPAPPADDEGAGQQWNEARRQPQMATLGVAGTRPPAPYNWIVFGFLYLLCSVNTAIVIRTLEGVVLEAVPKPVATVVIAMICAYVHGRAMNRLKAALLT